VAGLPGSPDIVLPRYKAVIFVHGCFWHGHSGCRKSRLPTTGHDFWEKKRGANLERDARKINELLNAEWRVAVVWQCALEKLDNFRSTMNTLEDWIHADDRKCEVPKSMKTFSTNFS
jgi:DNA mismatch endonuclease (patch repair protein)